MVMADGESDGDLDSSDTDDELRTRECARPYSSPFPAVRWFDDSHGAAWLIYPPVVRRRPLPPRTKEMISPCLTYLRVISLVVFSAFRSPTTRRCDRRSPEVAGAAGVSAQPKRWHAGRSDRVDHLFGADPQTWVLQDVWKECKTNDGYVYYHNEKREKASWTCPPPSAPPTSAPPPAVVPASVPAATPPAGACSASPRLSEAAASEAAEALSGLFGAAEDWGAPAAKAEAAGGGESVPASVI